MRLSFHCDDAVVGLSRVLDQIRRLGLDVKDLRATSFPGTTAIAIELADVPAVVGRTLFDRIAQIGGVRGLGVDGDGSDRPEPGTQARETASCTGTSGHG